MLYVKVENETARRYSLAALHADHPDVSFPIEPSAECLAEFGVFALVETDPPATSPSQTVIEGEPELVDDQWTQTWATAPVPLDERKAAMWQQVKARRASLTDDPGATVATPAGVVQSDSKSQQNILGLVQMAVLANISAQPFAADFTLADNTVVTLNASQMIGLGVAVGQHVQAVYAQATALRQVIEAAEDHEALDLIDVEAGWP